MGSYVGIAAVYDEHLVEIIESLYDASVRITIDRRLEVQRIHGLDLVLPPSGWVPIDYEGMRDEFSDHNHCAVKSAEGMKVSRVSLPQMPDELKDLFEQAKVKT